jgi:hypothetical protein
MDTRTQPQTVIGGLSYLSRTGLGTATPVNYMYPPPAGEPWQTCEYELREVPIADLRTAEPPELEREGFVLFEAPTRVIDFHAEDAIRAIYYAEAAELARAATGARRAYVFDHLVRKRDPSAARATVRRPPSAASTTITPRPPAACASGAS